jgi:hypothetical protein
MIHKREQGDKEHDVDLVLIASEIGRWIGARRSKVTLYPNHDIINDTTTSQLRVTPSSTHEPSEITDLTTLFVNSRPLGRLSLI